jgi:hypothetical protein
MVGIIGTHMLLWVPSQDSVVRLWDKSLHCHDSESCGGTHRVDPEALSKLEAQALTKFHMYCFVLH